MAFESDKIMFEIYKDTLYNKNYRVVFYTELNEHNKHTEISRAQVGEHYFDGFIKDYKKNESKKIIEDIVNELNDGKEIPINEVKDRLKDYLP